jgi:hypothetical protein
VFADMQPKATTAHRRDKTYKQSQAEARSAKDIALRSSTACGASNEGAWRVRPERCAPNADAGGSGDTNQR